MDDELRGLERRVSAGDKSVVEALQRAYLRSGRELEYVNLVLTERLSSLYHDDTGVRRHILGASIYDVAAAILETEGPADIQNYNIAIRGPGEERRHRRWDYDDYYDGSYPYVFVVSARLGAANDRFEWMTCVGMQRSRYNDTPDSYWPMLSPWVPPTDKGMPARHGRVIAFAKNPPKDVFRISRRTASLWAEAKRKTSSWLTGQHSIGSVNGAREEIWECLSDNRDEIPQWSLRAWLLIACDIFLDREINACLDGVPDLGPLARLIGLNWRQWFDRTVHTPLLHEAFKLPINVPFEEVQRITRATLGISEELLPWTPPKAPEPYRHSPYHQRPLDPKPIMPKIRSKRR